jgi:hypothetical protein
MVLVYVEGGDAQALRDTCVNLRKAITKVRRDTGVVVEVVIVGDFNRHDQLWGGDDVSLERQGEADPIMRLICSYHVQCLARDSCISSALGLVGIQGRSNRLVLRGAWNLTPIKQQICNTRTRLESFASYPNSLNQQMLASQERRTHNVQSVLAHSFAQLPPDIQELLHAVAFLCEPISALEQTKSSLSTAKPQYRFALQELKKGRVRLLEVDEQIAQRERYGPPLSSDERREFNKRYQEAEETVLNGRAF